MLFVGRDTNFRYDLWTTNGTGAGTKELTGIAGANASGVLAAASTATNSPDFTVYNGAVLFNGLNNVGAGVHGLWTTNGTAPGTHEVTGINGAASTGVNPIDMTVFNGSVLFNGVDGAGHQGLWVTNGTGAGTKEVTGINGAASTGIDPTDMTVFNGEVLFNGVDNTGAGLSGLWVTNGTAPGTHEITVAGGADPSGLNPTDLTVFGNEVLFNGLDQNGHPQLWETNGTATTELTGIPGANASANASGIAPSDLTVFNGEVLFSGLDTTGHQQLWETNGTVAGTKELYAPAWGLQPTNMEVYNGQVLFSGYDFHGGTPFHSLWTTDGTAIGTHEVATIANTYSIGLFPTDLTALRSTTPPNFFNSDNKADILWQNANGDTELWNSVSGSESFTGEDLGVVGGGWQIAGTGAFNGASEAGILWRNSNGDTGLWNANGSGGFTYQDLGVVSTSWQVAGTGDFNGDGEDILWRNTNGDTELWNANGAGGFSGQDLGVVPTSWQVAGTGDFTGTGDDSILWRNSQWRHGVVEPQRLGRLQRAGSGRRSDQLASRRDRRLHRDRSKTAFCGATATAIRSCGTPTARAASPARISASFRPAGKSPGPATSAATANPAFYGATATAIRSCGTPTARAASPARISASSRPAGLCTKFSLEMTNRVNDPRCIGNR